MESQNGRGGGGGWDIKGLYAGGILKDIKDQNGRSGGGGWDIKGF